MILLLPLTLVSFKNGFLNNQRIPLTTFNISAKFAEINTENSLGNKSYYLAQRNYSLLNNEDDKNEIQKTEWY